MNGRYWDGWFGLASGLPLRRISRLIVERLRFNSPAIARIDFCSRHRSAMHTRSSSDRKRAEIRAQAVPFLGPRMGLVLARVTDNRLDRGPNRLASRLGGPHARTAPADPLLARSTVDADDAAGLSDTHAFAYQFEKPLLDLGGHPLAVRAPPNGASVLQRPPGGRVLRRSLEPE